MNGECVTTTTGSAEETIALGRRVGRALRSGDVVALVGRLGSGKTWFAKGLALGLGVPDGVVVTSPSFALVNEYEGRVPFYHMDAYRLESKDAFVAAGLEEFFYEDGVVAMEWADLFPEMLPEHRIEVRLEVVDETTRRMFLTGRSNRAAEIIRALSMEEEGRSKEWR
ncbi:MAG: tRNA (adenosine(37)-N6)-threonylcarbamoyltransferase complex ATPase subunit type 1 TsaE [Deltaproteobacteria bacterium]|nr:MAG: tRNA (adenosine(37)-N6)-threonylcarbamoyltransferase complex ATPase subunit type 1 TsaE [Deltaproteobacteria bacterium]